jgi:PAS domain S-box-containing protein
LIAGKELVSSDAPDDTQAHISRIIHNETEYLPRMHAIVGMLGDEATDRVNSLKMIETALCASIIIALVLEILLVFEPAARKIASQFNDLEKAKIRLASEFNALNRSTPRAEVNLEGKITEANDQFLNCLQYSRGEFLERPLSSLIQDKKQKSLHEEIWQDVLQGNYRTEEVKWLSQSGEEKHIQSTLNPIKDHNGNVTRIVIYANDFTENVLAEQEKQRLNSELNEAARQAGMAEVATGVLHNIGNVLTSVNVSASVLRNQITSIPMRHLARAADIIGENRSNLAEFLTEDDRGKKFPVFLEQLTNNFETGHTELLKEADDLSDHVEHIIELISMQQSVAGRGGTMQNIELSNLVNDAIHLNQSSLNSHYVEVTRELEEEVTLATNRHEILQILVNLIRNGLQATRGIQRDPTLTVVAREQDGFAVISVTDNGVGIAKEDLCKLFEYGYTTKEDGNGFGLHASANIANALGGKVTVVSDGIDQGATSVLRIPLSHPKAQSDCTPAVNSQAI